MDVCIVCRNPLDRTEQRATCPNGHALHIRPCLKNWYASSKSTRCPICQEPLDPKKYGQWFAKFDEELARAAQEEENQKRRAEEKTQSQANARRDQLRETFRPILARFRAGEVELAFNDAFDLYEEDPKNRDALFLVGRLGFELGKYGVAVGHFMKLLKIKTYPSAYYYLGKTYERLELFSDAKWAFDRAEVTPEEWESSNVLDTADYNGFIKQLREEKRTGEPMISEVVAIPQPKPKALATVPPAIVPTLAPHREISLDAGSLKENADYLSHEFRARRKEELQREWEEIGKREWKDAVARVRIRQQERLERKEALPPAEREKIEAKTKEWKANALREIQERDRNHLPNHSA